MTDESTIAASAQALKPKVDCETGLSEFATLVMLLGDKLAELELAAKPLRLEPLAGRDWFDLLTRKLLPQLADGAYLIVAVVGGTNIGKSVVFNHIAGFRASASSPLASGTKHPVCLVPMGFAEQHDLRAMFPAFELRSWTSGDEALLSIDTHCLFWRTHESVPKNLVILDTPDVDSDAPVNWQRADAVRQAADVLVAVLTQQKYNDAAVKQFFRKAAAEDKAAIIVFNQVELPDDEPYWPIWLNTFCGETGLQPEYVYLAPNDRKAAEAIALRFEERRWVKREGSGQWEVGSGKETFVDGENAQSQSAITPIYLASGTSPHCPLPTPHSLASVLSQLRFAEIKLRTLRGSIARLVDGEAGVPAYLREVQTRSRQFRDAADVFASRAMVRQANWPAPPNGLLVDEMWSWWDDHREAWTASVHGFYSRIGRVLTGGVRLVRDRVWGAPPPPLDEYRRQEWDAIVRVLEQVYEQLQLITTLGNELLTVRLERLLSGASCETVLDHLRREHEQFDFAALVKGLVNAEMTVLKTDRQQLFQMLRQADRAAAVFRPALTLLLAAGGGFGADHLLTEAATQTLTHVAVDTTGAAATTVGGELVVETAGGVLGQAKAWLLQLHQKFKAERETWLVAQLRDHLLGELLDELQAGANVPAAAAFGEVAAALGELTSQLNDSAG
ncbi:MAG: 50S ribosome-binding GTPase [Candidatus Saccharimonas sp.]|nr:50S ribosome-binding GTPase [Planctomycetaceae bacterium]